MEKAMVYTVTIHDNGDNEMQPWVSAFSSREKAEAFKLDAERKLESYGVLNVTSVTLDSGELDSDLYLDFIDARYDY